MSNAIDLNGRVAIVTGGASGIGRAVVARFIASGARVALLDRTAELAAAAAAAFNQDAGTGAGPVMAFGVDVCDAGAVGDAVTATRDTFGRIDILVNSAGIAGPNAPTWEYPIEAWRRVMAVDLEGTFLCCRAVAPVMIAQGYGRIVNVASVAGKEGNPDASAYSAAKAGVIALTKSLGKELASYDIAVNCVAPGASPTPLFGEMSEEYIAYMLSKIPRGRFVSVEEVAATIAFAASSDCSFTTGAVFDISGGRATY